jgi:PEP-CTERM motif
MRKTLFLLLALALAYPAAAHADTITFSVSVVASGFAGFTPFTNERVTFAETAPADLVTEKVMDSGGGTPYSFGICFDFGSTVTIQGVGTGGGPVLTCVFHNFSNGSYLVGDGNDGLSIDVPLAFDSFQSSVGPVAGIASSNFGDSCDPEVNQPCPPDFAGVTFTSIEPDTGIAAMIVTSSTPEPSTFVLLATGLLGLGYKLRRTGSTNV